MSTQATKLTFEAWLAMPETKQRCDVVDGVMRMAPSATPTHQWFVQQIFLRLFGFVDERGIGVVMVAPLDLVISRDPLRVRQPDIMYLSAERSGIRGLADLRGIQVLEAPPDLVVEVLSPSNTRQEMTEKLGDYRRMGVLECWLVDLEANSIEVWRLSPGEITDLAIYGGEEILQSVVLVGFALPLREIFQDT